MDSNIQLNETLNYDFYQQHMKYQVLFIPNRSVVTLWIILVTFNHSTELSRITGAKDAMWGHMADLLNHTDGAQLPIK